MFNIYTKTKKKKGFVSIEAIISITGALIFFSIIIGMICYNLPRIALEKDVQYLAQQAKVQGGLTQNNIDVFLDMMDKRGYDKTKITVTAKTYSGNVNCINVSAMNTDGTNYIKKDSNDLIVVTMIVPANKGFLSGPVAFFGGENILKDNYTVSEIVASERW